MSSAKVKKEYKEFESARDFKLEHQVLSIEEFNFESESIVGYVNMVIHPQTPELTRVKINCKQCEIYDVSVNGLEAEVLYCDPTLNICSEDSKSRSLDYFESHHSAAVAAVDADAGNGELIVEIPASVLPAVQEMKSINVNIEFKIEKPKGGIKFVVPDLDGTLLDRGAHVFTCGRENSSRLWFPCIDCYSEVCTWKLEFTVNMYMVAVSVGDLVETIYTEDLRRKTYHYFMSAPTAAPNIALAVGPFEVFVDPHMHEVTHFCLPRMLPLLKQTTSFFHEVIEYYEENLSTRFPYTCYKQVFVDMAYSEIAPYASMTICSLYLLTHQEVIDQTPITRHLLAQAMAQQFFGCFISMNSWCDAWLPKGLAAYLCSQYRIKAFGNNALRYCIAQDMREVCEHEQQMGPVVLDPSVVRDVGLYFPTRSPHTTSPIYSAIYEKKALLIVRMLAQRIGQIQMFQVLNKLITLATNASKQKFSSNTWSNMLISTSSFLKCISSVTGKDVSPFVEQWVHQGGVARFLGSFNFIAKRNVVEIELKQDWTAKGTIKYAGPLTVTIQELDGTFHHLFMIEENKTKFEITCHSKSRRQKKKKIPLSTGEEVEMNLDDTDPASPVLWLRVDPEMTILRHVKLEQADFHWQYMLRYERCVTSQYEAICALEQYPCSKTRAALIAIIEDSRMYYQVRIDAAKCLTKVANAMVRDWNGPPAMMMIFQKMFGSRSCPQIIRLNDFTNLQQYFLQRAIPLAMAGLRNVHNICPSDVLQFLLGLIKYNENCKNKFEDGYYRAALVDALAATVTPAVTPVTITGSGPSTDSLTADTKLILDEVVLYMNAEKLWPCFHLSVTVSCLKAFSTMQRLGHLPPVPGIFKGYAVEGHILGVRLAALEALVYHAAAESSSEILCWLLDVVENDGDPYVRFCVIQMLTEHPPFSKRESPLNTVELMERLWDMMNTRFAYDSRLRCAIADLYYVLYGRSRPSCLRTPDDGLFETSFTKSEDSHGSLYGKRRTRSPLPSTSFDAKVPDFSTEMNVESTYAQDDGSSFKLKIMFGGNQSGSSRSNSPIKSAFSSHQSFGAGQSYSFSEKFSSNTPFSSNFPTSPFSSVGSSEAVPKAAFEVTVKDDDTSMRLSEDSSDSSSPEYDHHDLEQTSSPPPPPKLFGSSPMFSFSADNPALRLGSMPLGNPTANPMPVFASSSSSWLASSASEFTGLSGPQDLSANPMSVSGDFREQQTHKKDDELKPRKRKGSGDSEDHPLNLSRYRTSSTNSSGSSPMFNRESSPEDIM